MPAEPPVDPPPDDDEFAPPEFCFGCGLPIGEPHGCECERVVEVRVLIRLEDTTS